MDHYLAKFEEALNTGEPEMKAWFLVENNYLPFVLSGLYILITTKLGPAFMYNRKPFDLRNSMITFNFLVVAIYIVCTSLSIWYMWNLPYICSYFTYFCEGAVFKKGELVYTLARVGWVMYIMKYVEFLDTIFFILRKKQNLVSFLHVTHHALLPLLIWLTIRTEKGAIQMIPLLLNGFVHIFMYSYYGLAAMGPAIRKRLWWKKYLTQLQMVQFFLIILLIAVAVPLTGCRVGVFTYVTNVCFVPLVLYLFFKFYKEAYQSRSKSKQVGENLNRQENGFSSSHSKDN